MRRGAARTLACAGTVLLAGTAAAVACPLPPPPVIMLGFDSRYRDGDPTRSDIDPAAATAAISAIAPVDDFLRDLVPMANAVVRGDAAADADCVLSQIAAWARAGALTGLETDTVRLTIGSRIAALALVLRQVLPEATNIYDAAVVAEWLTALMEEQVAFWDEAAPPGARRGNLRAWAALAGAGVAAVTRDAGMRDWSAASVTDVLCTVAPDGSIPQEMTRGRLALHYQLHAVAPLVVSALLLNEQGQPVHHVCDDALGRAAVFAAMDSQTGEATAAITGVVQSYFDGSDRIEAFHLAWIEAYLRLPDMPGQPELDRLAAAWRPLGYSKLGGNQTLLWGD